MSDTYKRIMKIVPFLILLVGLVHGRDMELILDEEFKTFNLSLWRHQITMGGGGNWEFEVYTNNRSNSYVRDGMLSIKPTLMVDDIGRLIKSHTLIALYLQIHYLQYIVYICKCDRETHSPPNTQTHTHTNIQIGEVNMKTPGYSLDIWGGTPADLCTAPNFYGCFRTVQAGGNWINPVKSASVRTAGSFSIKYGRVEVRVTPTFTHSLSGTVTTACTHTL